MHLRSTSGTYQMRQNLPAQTIQDIRTAGTFRYVRTPGTLPQPPIVPAEPSGTQFVPGEHWFSEPHAKDLVPELILNLIPRTCLTNLVPPKNKPGSQDLQTPPSKNSPEVPEPAYWNRPKLAQVPLPLPHQSRLALCRWEVSLLPRHLTAWRTHPWGCPSKPLTSTSHTQSYTPLASVNLDIPKVPSPRAFERFHGEMNTWNTFFHPTLLPASSSEWLGAFSTT